MFADRSPRARLAELTPQPIRAVDDLRFIRETMARSSAFTAVPGWETAAIGVSALLASALAMHQANPALWLGIWLVEASLAFGFGSWATVRKARTLGIPIFSGPGRKYTLGLLPPMIAAALLTMVLYRSGAYAVLVPLWLLLCGAGVITGGAFSIRSVPIMGLCLMAVGVAALLLPVGRGDLYMAIGFGAVLIGFGAFFARSHNHGG